MTCFCEVRLRLSLKCACDLQPAAYNYNAAVLLVGDLRTRIGDKSFEMLCMWQHHACSTLLNRIRRAALQSRQCSLEYSRIHGIHTGSPQNGIQFMVWGRFAKLRLKHQRLPTEMHKHVEVKVGHGRSPATKRE